VVPLEPAVKYADLKDINARLASYSTYFSVRQRNRTYNIRKIARRMDDTLVRAGEVFSYNQRIGPRTQKLGFKIAPVLIHGELVPGTGGGACQVSTALYNLALLANLKIVRRSHHALPVHYVPAGRDATVVYGLIDLQFENTLDKPILIKAKIEGGRLTVSAFGTETAPQVVKVISQARKVIQPEIIIKEDSTIAEGKKILMRKGKPGCRVTTVRVVEVNGKRISAEVLSRDFYRPIAAIWRLGAKISTNATPSS